MEALIEGFFFAEQAAQTKTSSPLLSSDEVEQTPLRWVTPLHSEQLCPDAHNCMFGNLHKDPAQHIPVRTMMANGMQKSQ